MAFPFVTKFNTENMGVSSVEVDGEKMDFELYYGGRVEEDTHLSALNLDDVLSNVLLELPLEPEEGLLYTVLADTSALPDDTERIYIRMTFELELGVCCFNGFSGFASYEDGTRELSSWLYLDREDTPMTVFVSGGSLSGCTVGAYKSYEETAELLSDVQVDVEVKTASFREYVDACWENYAPSLMGERGPLDEKLYWAMLEEIDTFWSTYDRAVPVTELISYTRSMDRLAMAVYPVDFAPGETRNVKVNCTLEGVMERPSGYSSKHTTYTYTYLSNPAKAWADFGTLHIKAIPPEGLPLSASVPEIGMDEDGHYSAKLNGLPEENISFTLGEPASGLERAVAKASQLTWLFVPLIVVAAAIVALAMSFVRRVKRKNTED